MAATDEPDKRLKSAFNMRSTPLAANTSDAVNATRGIMVLLLVFIHWSPGVFERLGFADYRETLNPLFRVATPGFAIIFGLAIGLYIFERFDVDKQKARARLGIALRTLSVGILFLALVEYGNLYAKNMLADVHIIAAVFYSVLLYYFLGILSVPFWHKILNRADNLVFAALIGAAMFYAIAYFAKILLPNSAHLEGILRLGGLMIEAKYNYFNMSATVFLGLALGCYLHQKVVKNENAEHFFSIGIALIATGVAISFIFNVEHEWLTRDATPVWMDISYFGVVMLLLSLLLKYAFTERKGKFDLLCFRSFAILGTMALKIYVGHAIVIPTKNLLVSVGVPYVPALATPMIAFFIMILLPLRKYYAKYYG